MVSINSKIVSFEVVKDTVPELEKLTETVNRPESLVGYTYKIKPTNGEDALYVTINNIVLNQGTEFEETRPFEIFLNSKNVDHMQWTQALTRVISAVFRKGGDIDFLVEELQEIVNPNGGYFVGKKYMNGIVAHLGLILEQHLERVRKPTEVAIEPTVEESDYPESAMVCKKCKVKAVIMKDGCPTCLNCGDSKCG